MENLGTSPAIAMHGFSLESGENSYREGWERKAELRRAGRREAEDRPKLVIQTQISNQQLSSQTFLMVNHQTDLLPPREPVRG